jgi:hypothetical protein
MAAQRQAPRAPLVVAVDVWRGRAKELVLARDVSAGGLCLGAGRLLPQGSFVTVSVRLDDGAKFNAVCRVAWTDERRTGVAFVDVAEAARQALAGRVSPS